MKVSPKETLRKLFSDYVIYLKLFLVSVNTKENEFILMRLKENQEEISSYIKNKLKIKIEGSLNKLLEVLISVIKDLMKLKEKDEEYKDNLISISKEISQLFSSKKLLYNYKNSIKFLLKSLKFRIDNNYKKDIEYYDSFLNTQIKIADIISKIIITKNNNYKKKKGGCKLLGDVKCRCN